MRRSGKKYDAAFDFVKNMAWLCQSYTVEKAECTAESLLLLIEEIQKETERD